MFDWLFGKKTKVEPNYLKVNKPVFNKLYQSQEQLESLFSYWQWNNMRAVRPKLNERVLICNALYYSDGFPLLEIARLESDGYFVTDCKERILSDNIEFWQPLPSAPLKSFEKHFVETE